MDQSTDRTRDHGTIVTIVDRSQYNPSCFCYNRFVGLDSNGQFVADLGNSEVEQLRKSGQATLETKDELHTDGSGPCYTSADDETGVYDV